MTQKPRTTTRKTRSSKLVTRNIDAPLRLDAIEVQDLSIPSQESGPIWNELTAMASANEELVRLVERAKDLATSGHLRDNSIYTYAKIWRAFAHWCDEMGLVSLPACSATVLIYVAYRSDRGRSPSTINSDLSAIRSNHLRAGYTNPVDHDAISMARTSVSRQHAMKGEAKLKAHPLSLAEVRGMVGCLDQLIIGPSTVTDILRIRIKAVLLVAWFTGRRLDEIVRAELDWLKERDGTQFLESDHQKMKDNGFSTPIEKIADESICPWTALQAWLQASAPLRGDVQRIFALPRHAPSGELILIDKVNEVTQEKLAQGWKVGNAQSPSRTEFEAQCRAAGVLASSRELRYYLVKWMKLAGIEPDSASRSLGGHSMRRGLVTELRSAGVDPRVIANLVGWETLDLVEAYSDAAFKTNALDALNL